jgi:hypothetical protein
MANKEIEFLMANMEPRFFWVIDKEFAQPFIGVHRIIVKNLVCYGFQQIWYIGVQLLDYDDAWNMQGKKIKIIIPLICSIVSSVIRGSCESTW